MKTLKEKFEEFDRAFEGTIPEGEFTQFTISKGATVEQHDSTHDMSVVKENEDGTKEAFRVGTFSHAHYAGYIEFIVNAYRKGELVPRGDTIDC